MVRMGGKSQVKKPFIFPGVFGDIIVTAIFWPMGSWSFDPFFFSVFSMCLGGRFGMMWQSFRSILVGFFESKKSISSSRFN